MVFQNACKFVLYRAYLKDAEFAGNNNVLELIINYFQSRLSGFSFKQAPQQGRTWLVLNH